MTHPSDILRKAKETERTIHRYAELSPCKTYRYRLTRYWGPGAMLPFIMLNPSVADHEIDDPTIRRCMGFARREGLGGIVVANVHAFRATRPEDMKASPDPFGPANSDELWQVAVEAAANDVPVVCAWGVSGGMFGRDRDVITLLRSERARLVCLGQTANGMPRHPLYVRRNQPLESFDRAIALAEAGTP